MYYMHVCTLYIRRVRFYSALKNQFYIPPTKNAYLHKQTVPKSQATKALS